MTMKWDKETITHFLMMYSSQPCLWNPRSCDYKNREKRAFAMAEILRCLKINGLSLEMLKTKIHSIRNTYTNEIRKIMRSKINPYTPVYVPKISWFSFAHSFLWKASFDRRSHRTMQQLLPEDSSPPPSPDMESQACEISTAMKDKEINFHSLVYDRDKYLKKESLTHAEDELEQPLQASRSSPSPVMDFHVHEMSIASNEKGNDCQPLIHDRIKPSKKIPLSPPEDDELEQELHTGHSIPPPSPVKESHLPEISTAMKEEENSFHSLFYVGDNPQKKAAFSLPVDELEQPLHLEESSTSPDMESHVHEVSTAMKRKENNIHPISHDRIKSCKRGSFSLPEDELEAFRRSVVVQMRKLPEEYAVEIMLEIQSLLTKKRLKFIADKRQTVEHGAESKLCSYN